MSRLWGAAALILAGASSATADVTVVTKTTVSGAPGLADRLPGGNGSVTTAYYKNGQARSETPAGIVIATPERVYQIDTKARTYQVISRKRLAEQGNPTLEQFQMKTDVKVTTGGKTDTILGKPVKNYLVVTTIRMTPPRGMAPSNGGPATPITLTLRMELWMTEALGISQIPEPPNLGPALSFMKPMMEKIRTIKGLPLRTISTQTIEGLGGERSPGITVRAEAVSLSVKPLPDSLFVPPKGYKQLPYTGPSLPGLMGRPGRVGS